MSRRLATALLAGLALAGGGAAADAAMKDQRPRRSTELPRPRDPDVAVGQELAVARKTNTLAAYDLFIARHPDHPLAAVARQEREALLRRPG